MFICVKARKKKPLGVSIFFLPYGSRNSAQVLSLTTSAFSRWAILLAFFFFKSLDRILCIPGWPQPPSVAEDDLEPAWCTRLPVAMVGSRNGIQIGFRFSGLPQCWNCRQVPHMVTADVDADVEPESSWSLLALAAFSFLGGATVFSW